MSIESTLTEASFCARCGTLSGTGQMQSHALESLPLWKGCRIKYSTTMQSWEGSWNSYFPNAVHRNLPGFTPLAGTGTKL